MPRSLLLSFSSPTSFFSPPRHACHYSPTAHLPPLAHSCCLAVHPSSPTGLLEGRRGGRAFIDYDGWWFRVTAGDATRQWRYRRRPGMTPGHTFVRRAAISACPHVMTLPEGGGSVQAAFPGVRRDLARLGTIGEETGRDLFKLLRGTHLPTTYLPTFHYLRGQAPRFPLSSPFPASTTTRLTTARTQLNGHLDIYYTG